MSMLLYAHHVLMVGTAPKIQRGTAVWRVRQDIGRTIAGMAPPIALSVRPVRKDSSFRLRTSTVQTVPRAPGRMKLRPITYPRASPVHRAAARMMKGAPWSVKDVHLARTASHPARKVYALSVLAGTSPARPTCRHARRALRVCTNYS